MGKISGMKTRRGSLPNSISQPFPRKHHNPCTKRTRKKPLLRNTMLRANHLQAKTRRRMSSRP